MSLGVGQNKRRWRKKDWSHWDEAKRVTDFCGEKIIYYTYEAAEMMRRQQSERWDKELRIYTCPTCLNYHLTSRII